MATTLLGSYDQSLLGGNWVVDVSQVPVELVAHAMKFRDRRFQSQMLHPDIWAPDDWV